MLDTINSLVKEAEKQIETDGQSDPAVEPLQSVPGIGLIVGNVMACEIDGIACFRTVRHFLGYCGLVPSTYSSGGKTHHRRMLAGCNKWLKSAFIEAAWVEVDCSPDFGELYAHHRGHGKKANTVLRQLSRVRIAVPGFGPDNTCSRPEARPA